MIWCWPHLSGVQEAICRQVSIAEPVGPVELLARVHEDWGSLSMRRLRVHLAHLSANGVPVREARQLRDPEAVYRIGAAPC